MSKTARIHDGAIVEFLVIPSGPDVPEDLTLEDCYHPDLLAFCIEVPDTAKIGWIRGGDGTWGSPPIQAPRPRTTTVSALLDALSTSQRAAITPDHMSRLVARAATGPVVMTDPKVVRAAGDMTITPAAWFDAALA